MKKLLFFIFSLTLFVPFLNADEVNYFNWEKVEVSALPEASDSTLNIVFIYDNHYYITNSVTIGGNNEPLPLNTNFNGKTIYVDPDYTKRSQICNNLPSNYYKSWCSPSNNFCYEKYAGQIGFRVTGQFHRSTGAINNSNNETLISCSETDYVDYVVLSADFSISSYNSDTTLYQSMFSLTPFDTSTSYSWIEVSKNQVYLLEEHKVYVPTNNLKCYTFIDRFTLRGYENQPIVNDTVTYYDFYLDRHYDSVEGTETIESSVTCLSNTTTDYLYRNDIVTILIFCFLVGLIVIYLPIKIIFRLYRRGNS